MKINIVMIYLRSHPLQNNLTILKQCMSTLFRKFCEMLNKNYFYFI